MFYLERPIAHRGLHDKVNPENSLGAFAKAIENGYCIELDVHLSKDQTVVVFHDESLERMTGSGGEVSQYVLQSLRNLRLGDTDEKIPTLKEVLDFVAGRVPIVIEIKCNKHDGTIESEVMKLLVHYQGEYTIQSFNPYTLKWIREHYSQVILGLLVTNDFGGTKLKFYEKFVLRYMSFLPVIRPDYIGLDYESFSLIQYFIIKKLTLAKIIFWTISDKETYLECRELCDNIIFENFIPMESK